MYRFHLFPIFGLMQLKGKTAIVTGATSGMGRAIALAYAKEGANVVASGRNETAGRTLVDEINDQAGKAIFVKGDVADPAVNESLVKRALSEFGQLDIVCTNAGDLGLGKVTELPIAAWQRTLDVNLSSVFYLLKYALPEMMKQPGASVVVNASIAAFKFFPNHPAYCASKAGLVALARQVAVDYSPNVRVNIMCPGPVDTPLIHDSAKAFPDPAIAVENAGKSTLLQRLGQPVDIASLALFLASDASSWMTGAVIPIDGGALTAS